MDKEDIHFSILSVICVMFFGFCVGATLEIYLLTEELNNRPTKIEILDEMFPTLGGRVVAKYKEEKGYEDNLVNVQATYTKEFYKVPLTVKDWERIRVNDYLFLGKNKSEYKKIKMKKLLEMP